VGYELQGVLASEAGLERCRAFRNARVVVLGRGVRLLLMTDDFFDEVRRPGVEVPLPGFWKLPTGFDRLLAAWSVRAPLAYVEAEYFGGVGTQVAAVWDTGERVMGPLAVHEGPPVLASPSPISLALRRLGVSADGHVDEFDAVGLGRHRNMDGWLQETHISGQ
jgi:hypothetical protein